MVGLGYVGLPLALTYAAAGYRVLGFDVDPAKVERLRAGESYIEHIPGPRIADARRAGFDATTDMSRAAGADALILCVPTPLDRHREPDLRFVTSTMDALAPHLRAGQVVSLESTTYPGTTEEELLPRIGAQGWTVGQDVFLVYSPEREDPGNAVFVTRTIPKVVGGHTDACLEVGLALYRKAIDRLVPVSSTRAAEMTKLLENIHRAVNIGLVNEMKIVADRMGLDIFEIIDAAATKPFGFTAYQPGPGLGGHCIPIDPFYLTWKAREYGVHTRFIELAGEVNRAMPEYVVGKVMDGLNRHGKALNGARVLILGIAYKKNVGDMRESPSGRDHGAPPPQGRRPRLQRPARAHVPAHAGAPVRPGQPGSDPRDPRQLRRRRPRHRPRRVRLRPDPAPRTPGGGQPRPVPRRVRERGPGLRAALPVGRPGRPSGGPCVPELRRRDVLPAPRRVHFDREPAFGFQGAAPRSRADGRAHVVPHER